MKDNSVSLVLGGEVCGRCHRASNPGETLQPCGDVRCPILTRTAGSGTFLISKVPAIRCEGCDNGLGHGWAYCAYCGRRIAPVDDAA